jgi:O-acetyl-ADP-ribose deacetylase (regulator of RNase III)
MARNLADRIRILCGHPDADITRLNVDAIVNAANENLRNGGGVAKRIRDAAGSGLDDECRRLAPCPTGRACLTKGYSLPAKYVIHAVGPDCRKTLLAEPAMLLRACYEASLHLAVEHQFRTIAFPSISTGKFRYPKEEACQIAVDAVAAWLRMHEYPEEVTFCCTNGDTAEIYIKQLKEAIGG